MGKDIEINALKDAAGKLYKIAQQPSLSIISLLEKHNRLTVTEIYQKVKITQSTASHHLRKLKNMDILSSEKDGNHMYYSLHLNVLNNIKEYCNKLSQNHISY